MSTSEETDAKVRRALSVFEALRSAMDVEGASVPSSVGAPHGSTGTPLASSSTSPTATSARKLTRRRKGGEQKKSGATAKEGRDLGVAGDANVDSYVYTSPETLESMTTAVLRRRLVTAEGLLHRLHQQHRALEHKVTFLEKQNDGQAAKIQRLESADVDLETRVQTRCQAREADLRSHQEAALKSMQERHQKQLSTLSRRHEAALHEMQVALDQSKETNAARRTTAAMADQLGAAQKYATAVTAERDALAETVATLEAQLSTAKARTAISDDAAAAGDGDAEPRTDRTRMSTCTTRLQDQVTTLEFRLKQLEMHCNELQGIHLAAVLSGEQTPASLGSKKPLNALVNQEVRKLFECMKRRMTADAVVMEAERSRLNELLLGLEHELAARD